MARDVTIYQGEFPVTSMKDKNSKWRIVSCLQKAIRRGDTATATKMLNALYDAEKSYALYRLTVIALEDVGAGNPPLVHEWLQYVSNKEIRETYSEEENKRVVFQFVIDMCESVHDRNACDLLCCADWLQEYAGLREWASEASEIELALMASSQSADLIERTICLWNLAGTSKFKSPVMVEREGRVSSLLEVYRRMGLSEQYVDLVKIGSMWQREGHPITIGLTIMESQDADSWVDDDLISLGRIKMTYLSSAFDMHTWEGKKAIAYFRKSCSELGAWLNENGIESFDDYVKVVGSAVFRLEGHQVSKRLQYPMNAWIQEKTSQAFARCSGLLSVDKGLEVREIVRRNIHLLHEARSKVTM